ncbi:helix-turn-helix domain-containing protein [Isobaculum melis]|uniref:Mga helix-turn-helix domain-containing protein n=1 Tax=Isobaculum melis TaxID=142588 RepID=A0A1H9SS12_9LACT|nr:helix-turn-helix domain-containing protein [Isobaculum melis]SER87193.1 Mga helix-turn-helix domain-containing protein [Isobaculum melis]
MINFLLEKQSNQKLSVLSYLIFCESKTANIVDIIKDLNLSEFLVTKAIKGIAADIETYKIQNLTIQLQEKKATLVLSETDSLHKLSWYYINDSISFKLFDTIFKKSLTSLESFAKQQFISFSKAYLLKIEIEEELKKHGIQITSDLSFTGQESTVRFLLFQIYFTSFNGLSYPFSSTIEKIVTQFTQLIQGLLTTKLSETQLLKLTFFSAITFERIYQQHHVSFTEDEAFTLQNESSFTLAINDFFKEHTTMNDDFIQSETQFLQIFLISEKLIMVDKENILFKKNNVFLKIESMTLLFFDSFTQYFKKPLSQKLTTALEKEIFRINYAFIFIRPFYLKSYFKINDPFIKECYPDFHAFSTLFISTLSNQISDLEEPHKDCLLHDYLFALIQIIPNTYFNEAIHICVDFSSGPIYNHFIGEKIKLFKFFNIRIERYLSKQTDIYLSDILLPNIHCKTLIWNTLPLASDWESLGNQIIRINNEKLKKRMPHM